LVVASRRARAILEVPECAAAGLSRYAEDQHPRLFSSLWVTAMPDGAGSLFDDLDAALQSGSSEKRVAVLRRVTVDQLSKPNAQRLLRFWQLREVSARSI
jgi:hypothetical protein